MQPNKQKKTQAKTWLASQETVARPRAARPPTITINKSAKKVFDFCSDFSNAPKFMLGVRSVELVGDGHWEWTVAEKNETTKFQTYLTGSEGTTRLTWTSGTEPDSGVKFEATFEAAPGGRGTVVTLHSSEDESRPGKISGILSYFIGKDSVPRSQLNLYRLKAFLETGEVPTIEGQPTGRDSETLH